MKITVQNIVNEYPKIGIELPEPLANDKFEKLKTTFLPNYNKSDVIKKMVDTFVLKLNEVLAKEAHKQKQAEEKPPKTSKPQSMEVKNDRKEDRTVKKRPKSVTKAVKSDTISVDHITEDIRLLRRFYACLGKERKHGTILTIYRDFERRITERKVNRESKHGDLVWQCNKKLSTLLNEMERQGLTHVKLEVEKEFADKLKAAANEVAVRSSVNLLKRFIGIEGETYPDKKKVQRLYDSFEKAIKSKKVTSEDLYAEEFKEAKQAMKAYLNEDTISIKVSATTLRGLAGLGKPKAASKSLDGTAQSKDTISFNKAMILAKRDGFKSFDVFKLGITKKALKDIIGETQMFLSGAVLKKIMQKDKDHSLLWHNLINLPDSINNPAAIFQSKSKGYVVLTEIRNYRNKPVMAAIQINEKIEIVDIKSMYAKTRTSIYRKWEEEGLLLYKNNKSDLVKSTLAPVASSTPQSLCKNKGTENTTKSNLSGIENEPFVLNRFQVEISGLEPERPINPEPPQNNELLSGLFTPITQQPAESSHEKTILPGDLGKFLGYVERYEYAILLRGEKGAGKTRLLYQLMNTFARGGFTVGSFSLEIGKQSNLIADMRNQYISPIIANKVFIADTVPNGLEDVKKAAKQFDVVCIDSWGKIPGTKPDDFDKLRKEFPKTMFIVIFQSTTNGTARGGSMPEYDAGIVIQVADGGRAYCEKNRYNGEDLTYLVFERKLEQPEIQPVV